MLNFTCRCGMSGRVAYTVFVRWLKLKGQGHVTVNKPVISIIYIVVHMWPLCSAQILVDGVNPQESYFRKSTNISAIIQHMSVSFVSLRSSRVRLQNNTFILKKKQWKVSVIWPIKSTAKSSFRNKFVYITWPCPFKLGRVRSNSGWVTSEAWPHNSPCRPSEGTLN